VKSILYCLVATTSLHGVAAAQIRDDEKAPRPTEIVIGDQQKPVAPPAAGQEVQVLSIALDVARGEVRSARVVSSKRIASVAPKVFARKGGDWEVVLYGATRRSFFVNSPARREAEAHKSSNDRYEWVDVTGTIEWPLVVPLYADGRPLGVRSITIRDTRSGATILQTDI
jgi:hypothetical protein